MKFKFAVLALAVCVLAGCQTAQIKARDLAIKGMVDTGRTVNKELVKSSLTPAEQALLDASNFQLDAAEKLVKSSK